MIKNSNYKDNISVEIKAMSINDISKILQIKNNQWINKILRNIRNIWFIFIKWKNV